MEYPITAIQEMVQDKSKILVRLRDQISRVVVGQSVLVERLLVGLLANGHILLEGVPGLAKSLSVETFPAIVVVPEAHARFEPSNTGEVHYSLHEGERVEIKGEYDGWFAVERWDGKKGYLKETETIPIKLEKKE